jgi:hypothetical protein
VLRVVYVPGQTVKQKIFLNLNIKKMAVNNCITFVVLSILFYPIILFYIVVIVVFYLGVLKPILNKNKNEKI